MNTKISKADRSGRSSNVSEMLLSARSWILMLLLTLCLTRMGTTAFAQPQCMSLCQQQLAACLVVAQGDPLQEAQCQDAYDSCSEGCIWP